MVIPAFDTKNASLANRAAAGAAYSVVSYLFRPYNLFKVPISAAAQSASRIYLRYICLRISSTWFMFGMEFKTLSSEFV